MNLETWLENAANSLKNADKKQELALIVQKVLKLSPTAQRYKNPLLNETEIEQLDRLLNRRINGEPLAYILEEWGFFDLMLKVSP